MKERQTLTGAIMAALDGEVPGLHPSLTYDVARVAARVAVENVPLVIEGAMPWERAPQARPTLTVVGDLDDA